MSYERAHEVTVDKKGIYKCGVCGYRGRTPPPLPCLDPDELGRETARLLVTCYLSDDLDEERVYEDTVRDSSPRQLVALLAALAAAVGDTFEDQGDFSQWIIAKLSGRDEPEEDE